MIRFLTILVTILLSLPLAAANANEYQVQNIAVDVEGDNAIDAREKALRKARRNAFDIMARRLLTNEEQGQLPSVDDSTVATMINNFEINREKLSKNRYLANVSINFNPQAVRAYFGRYTNAALIDSTPSMTQNNNLPATMADPTSYDGQMATASEPANTATAKRLILPWYGQNENASLWRDTNTWKQAWNRWLATPQGAASNMILPIGDVTDMQYFNPEKPLNYDTAALNRLLQRYRAGDAIIAMADTMPNGMVRVSLYQSTNMMPRFIDRIVVPASQTGDTSQFLPAIYKSISSIQNLDVAAYSPTDTQVAINDTSSFARDNTITTPYQVDIRMNNIQQWVGIKTMLDRVNGLSDMQVKSLSAGRATIAFRYAGDADALRRDLMDRGLNFSANPQQASGTSPYIISRQQG